MTEELQSGTAPQITQEILDIIAENTRRRTADDHQCYNPLTGEGCGGPRTLINGKYLPDTMISACGGKEVLVQMSEIEQERLRIHHDFEFWCARCVTVKDKISARDCRLVLNRPQRRVVAMLEAERLRNRPLRMIMLKARQWGGSTLIQVYIAWHQLVLRTHCNSLICGHLRDSSATLRGMFNKILGNYPQELAPDGLTPSFKPYMSSRNISELKGRECIVVTGTAGTPEGVRSMDIAMAHLTEVAFWPHTPGKSPENIVRSVCGTIALEPGTLIVMESTANGIGNYFHREWLRAKQHKSDKIAAFVPWYEIEIYTTPRITDDEAAALWASLDDYEQHLWHHHQLTLEQIRWYHLKRREYASHSHMKAEYPTDDVEAFANSGNCVFPENQLDRLRSDCTVEPHYYVMNKPASGAGALSDLRMIPSERCPHALTVWTDPDIESRTWSGRYLVSVDVGGVTERADFSVITVIDRFGRGELPEVVAEWRGHTAHDTLAWFAAQVAQIYCKALLVIESNTLETEHSAANEGDGTPFVLSEISQYYSNIYRRSDSRVGFHTNKITKLNAIFNLMCIVRDHAYTERSADAVDELSAYEHKPKGAYGARDGFHDDMVMTRAIALWVARQLPGKPQHIAARDFIGVYI